MHKLVHFMLSPRSSKLSSFLKICFYSALIWWFLLFCLSQIIYTFFSTSPILVPSSVILVQLLHFSKVIDQKKEWLGQIQVWIQDFLCSMAVIPYQRQSCSRHWSRSPEVCIWAGFILIVWSLLAMAAFILLESNTSARKAGASARYGPRYTCWGSFRKLVRSRQFSMYSFCTVTGSKQASACMLLEKSLFRSLGKFHWFSKPAKGTHLIKIWIQDWGKSYMWFDSWEDPRLGYPHSSSVSPAKGLDPIHSLLLLPTWFHVDLFLRFGCRRCFCWSPGCFQQELIHM